MEELSGTGGTVSSCLSHHETELLATVRSEHGGDLRRERPVQNPFQAGRHMLYAEFGMVPGRRPLQLQPIRPPDLDGNRAAARS